MSSEAVRFWLTLVCVVAIVGGCASVPPAPSNAQNRDNAGNDEYEGWLWKSLTGRRTAETTQAALPDASAAAVAPPVADSPPVEAAPPATTPPVDTEPPPAPAPPVLVEGVPPVAGAPPMGLIKELPPEPARQAWWP